MATTTRNKLVLVAVFVASAFVGLTAQTAIDSGLRDMVISATAQQFAELKAKLDAIMTRLAGTAPPVPVVPIAPPVTPVVPVVPVPTGAGKLIQSGDLTYLGAFRVPQKPAGATYGFDYAQNGLAFNAARNSLFINNHQYAQQTAEITIPTPSLDTSALPRATFLQAFKDISEGHLGEIGANGAGCCANGNWLAGILVFGGRLIGSVHAFYDAGLEARRSHFTSSLDLASTGTFRGMYQLGSLNPGYVGGWMAEVPAEWRAALGGPVLTGQCCTTIISRTSLGPSAWVTDPATWTQTQVSATPLVYYPIDHATLGGWQDASANPAYNLSTSIGGMAFPAGTRSLLFFGRTDLGVPCYGPMTKDPTQTRRDAGNGQHYCYDPTGEEYTGPHCGTCSRFVWAYDAAELAAVKAGTKAPWDVRPYATWVLPVWPQFEPRMGYYTAGVAYDPATQRLFLSQTYGDAALPDGSWQAPAPIIHVFRVAL